MQTSTGVPSLPAVVRLDDPRAADPECAGSKAASLARSLQAGLDILPGFVLTTAVADLGVRDPGVLAALRGAWDELRAVHPGCVVVRSSSTVEDVAESSMAGQFTSVLDVTDWDGLIDAVERVLASAHQVPGAARAQPMAVIVQPQLDTFVGGVMFGIDPVTGDRHHVVVDAVAARVDDLVSGRVTAAHYVLSRHGRVIEVVHREVAPLLGRSARHRLVRLAARAARVFGTPQDLEWAIDRGDRLWLLQSRPVTAVAAPGVSVVLGPGPVAETFPAPLRTLESDLWIDPLRDAIVRALTTTRAVSRRRLRRSPVLVLVGGYAAVDLGLLGFVNVRRSRWRLLDPRAPARRLMAAWRVGRLRVALPALADETLAVVDDDLVSVGTLANFSDTELLASLDAARRELATVHVLEILAGMLLVPEAGRPSLFEVAGRALTDGRGEGLNDAGIISSRPEVLALVAPRADRTDPLPEVAAAVDGPPVGPADLMVREALRLRTRWLQELMARSVRELARRLVSRGSIPDPAAVCDCTLAELTGLVGGGAAPADLTARAAVRAGAPLPATFRLDAAGTVVPQAAATAHEGVPAGGGRAVGTVVHGWSGTVSDPGSVLVVGNLEPGLAAVLPALAGLVAETGSPLSHLAILAREAGVATVVAVPDARRRFVPGSLVVVDGITGEVSAVTEGRKV